MHIYIFFKLMYFSISLERAVTHDAVLDCAVADSKVRGIDCVTIRPVEIVIAEIAETGTKV